MNKILIDSCYLIDYNDSRSIKTIFGNAKIDNEGYFKITSKREGNYNKRLHRLIIEKFYQIKILDGWVVHHNNQNKLDNRITNLYLMRTEKHNKLHNISDKTAIKLSKVQNSTGYYRVKKHKDKSCKQGFIWRYCYYQGGSRRCIESVNLNSLKEKVIKNNLIWREL